MRDNIDLCEKEECHGNLCFAHGPLCSRCYCADCTRNKCGGGK